MKTSLKKLFLLLVYIFAAIGFVLVVVYIAVNSGLTNTKGIIDRQHDFFKNQAGSTTTPPSDTSWTQSPEWSVLSQAIIKDTDSINRAAQATGIPARIIVAPLVVEQLRLFYSNREIFKQIFAPLKILGNQSQFSWGVMGIKQDTAMAIEDHLKDSTSPYYLGPSFEHILDYSTSTDINSDRFARLTDENNRYYSYLYAALYMKEVENQWQKAGFPIDSSPGIVATLFNIGFNNSHPNPHPQIGGAEIDIGSTTYSFGGLAEDFYNSQELISEFPRK